MKNKKYLEIQSGFSIMEVMIAMFGVVLAAMTILQVVLNDSRQKKQIDNRNALTTIADTLVKEKGLDSCRSVLQRLQDVIPSYSPNQSSRTISANLTMTDAQNLTSASPGGALKPYIPLLSPSGMDISEFFRGFILRLFPIEQTLPSGDKLQYFTIQYTKVPLSGTSIWQTIPALETYKTQVSLFFDKKCD